MSTQDQSDGERTFILGVGAQKAGTTWLHEYLVSAPTVAPGKLKEYHIWDALYVWGSDFYQTRGHPQTEADQLRVMMLQDQANYFDYFDRLLQHGFKSVTMDITPSYAGLTQGNLRVIQDGFTARRIRTKAVFLMRDPVERCWSAARHAANMVQRIKGRPKEMAPAKIAELAFNRQFEMRTRYDLTMQSLTAAFRPEDLHIGIYENMFQPGPLRMLSSFCGVPFRPELAEQTVHATEKEGELGEDIYAAIARRYRIVYETVARTHPEVRELWPGFAYL